MAPGVSRCSRRRRAAPLRRRDLLCDARRSRCLLRGRVIERDPVSAQGSIFSARQRGIDSAPPRRRLPCRRAVCVTKQKGHARARRALGAAAGTRQRSRHPTHSGKQPCTRFRTRLRGRGVLERRAQEPWPLQSSVEATQGAYKGLSYGDACRRSTRFSGTKIVQGVACARAIRSDTFLAHPKPGQKRNCLSDRRHRPHPSVADARSAGSAMTCRARSRPRASRPHRPRARSRPTRPTTSSSTHCRRA